MYRLTMQHYGCPKKPILASVLAILDKDYVWSLELRLSTSHLLIIDLAVIQASQIPLACYPTSDSYSREYLQKKEDCSI
ncbi:hypothetical protein AO057_10805 [Curvibacter sp. PAE-UM]|nr:hypothetical protein AO057_10805 [Curvibacter sp. PAE-UM]